MKRHLLSLALFLFLLAPGLSSSQIYKVDERRIYDWDDFSNPEDWEQHTQEIYTYENGGNKETKILGLEFPSSNNQYQYIKTYDGSNYIILNITQYWDESSSPMQWEDASQDTYTYYTGTNNVKDVTSFSFIFGHDVFKMAYEYNGTNVTKITIQDGTSGTLVNSKQYIYTYNGSGLPETETDNNWNVITNMWDLNERGVATYTPGLRTLVIEKYNGSTWDLYERYLTYYTISLEKENEYIQQSRVGSNWENVDREVSIYDGNNNKTKYTWYSWSGSWDPYYKEEMGYSVATPLGLSSFEITNFKVFPNPTSDVMNLTSIIPIDRLEMFDITGKKVLSSMFTKQINAKDFQPGIYFLKATIDTKSITKKVIIK